MPSYSVLCRHNDTIHTVVLSYTIGLLFFYFFKVMNDVYNNSMYAKTLCQEGPNTINVELEAEHA